MPDSSLSALRSRVAVSGLLLLSACAASQCIRQRRRASVAADEPNELLVLEWSGYEDPDFWIDFAEANPDTEVTFEFGDTDANILAQMEGGSQADIFHFYTGWQQFYVDQGLVQEIDTSKLANWDQVPVEYQELGQVDGKQYFVPWDWGFTSILYNTEHVDEVTSWDALFNEEYAGSHLDVERRTRRRDGLRLHQRLGRDGHHR